MGSLDEVLNANEKVLFRTRLHWLACSPGALLLSLLALAVAIALLVFARGAVADFFGREPLAGSIAALALVLTFVVPLLAVRFLVRTHQYGVTDRRVIARMGWISTRTVDLNVTQVESLVIEQGALGRLFRFGDVKLVGTGGSSEVFRGVRDPIGFRKALNAASDRVLGRSESVA